MAGSSCITALLVKLLVQVLMQPTFEVICLESKLLQVQSDSSMVDKCGKDALRML